MKDQHIINIGKTIFGLCFLLGNICFFGDLFTKEDWFAEAGYMLIVLGAMFNLAVILGLLIYSFINWSQFDVCLKTIGIMLINIPIAVVYAVIGINLL